MLLSAMKVLTPTLSILALVGATASVGFYVVIGNTKEILQAELAQTEARANRLANDLGEATVNSEILRRQLSALDADLGNTKLKLTAAESRTVQLSRDLNQARSELTVREQTEAQLTQEVDTLERELVQSRLAAADSVTPAEAERYRRSIAELEGKLKTLEATLASAATSSTNASYDHTGASSATGQAATATFTANRALNARVVTVGPRDAFVILNYGANNGASMNQELLVRRGPDPVARVQISDVRPNHSVAQVISGTLSGSLRKGDAAMLSN
jgi:ribosomal protein L29